MGTDPGTGEDTVAEAEAADDGDRMHETNPHLLLYGTLRDEIRSRIASHHRSLLSGLSIIGVIVAYALLSGEFVFLAVIPVLIGVLVVQTIRQLNTLLFAAHHLGRIERNYVDEYPLFDWEHRHGMAGTDRGIERWGINWTNVPQLIVVTLAGLGYMGSIYAAYAVWPPQGIDILSIGLTRDGLLVIYVLVTLLVGSAGYSFFLHQAELTFCKGSQKND